MGQSAARPSTESFFADQAQVWEWRYESRTYRERRKLIRQIVKAEVARLGRPASEIEVLDFGCGGGVLLRDLLEMGLHVTGVDTSREMIGKAQSFLRDYGQTVELECLTTDSGAGKYERRNYDIVLCISVLEFVPEIEPLIARLAAVLRPGGILIVSVPNRQSWLRRLEQFLHRHSQALQRIPVFSNIVQKNAYLDVQKHQFTLAELTEEFERVGLARDEWSFQVAPVFLRMPENTPTIGMMLTAVFRK